MTTTPDALMDAGNDKPDVISVLIPLYNHEVTVERTLDSLLLSDASRIELLICDDASKDRSVQRATQWIERNGGRFESVCLLRNAQNLGINGNLNRLVATARGEFVRLLASDDMLPAGALDSQRAFLRNHPDIDFVFGNTLAIDEDDHIISREFVTPRRSKWIKRQPCALVDIILNWGSPWSSPFARRRPYLRMMPYPAELAFEDRWTGLNIAETRHFAYQDEAILLYRMRGQETATGGLSRQALLDSGREMERRVAARSTGLTRLLLRILIGSYRDASGCRGPRQYAYLLLREAIKRGHWLIAGKMDFNRVLRGRP